MYYNLCLFKVFKFTYLISDYSQTVWNFVATKSFTNHLVFVWIPELSNFLRHILSDTQLNKKIWELHPIRIKRFYSTCEIIKWTRTWSYLALIFAWKKNYDFFYMNCTNNDFLNKSSNSACLVNVTDVYVIPCPNSLCLCKCPMSSFFLNILLRPK